MNAHDYVGPTRLVMVLAFSASAALPACAASAGRAYEQGTIDAATRAARAWSGSLPPCDDAAARDGEQQIVGHLSDGGSTWQSTLLGCESGTRCCNTMAPMAFGLDEPGGRFTTIERSIPPLPLGRLDCEWGPWRRAMKETLVRATGTRGQYGLRVTALCRLPVPHD